MDKSKKKILIVEDDSLIRSMYESLFSNYEIAMAENKQEAFKCIEENKQFDMLLLDIMLPDGSGLDFLQEIRNRGIWIPTIVSSAFSNNQRVNISRELGAVCFIGKPASTKTIKNATRGILGENAEETCSVNENSFAYIQSAPDGTHKFVRFEGNRHLKLAKPLEEQDVNQARPLEFAVIDDNPKRITVCLSSQYGCTQGCKFCITGTRLNKNVRNVSCAEMDSMLAIARMYYGGFEEKNVRILFAGEGEPSRNLENVVKFMREHGDKFEYRMSTVGLVSTMPKLIEVLSSIPTFSQLQISLHAPNDVLRRKIMGSARMNPIWEILKFGEKFYEKSGKQVALNYVLFDGINDSNECIQQLIQLLKGRPGFFIRLSKANPVQVKGALFNFFEPISKKKTSLIERKLNAAGIQTKKFESHGKGISSPCGHMAARIGSR